MKTSLRRLFNYWLPPGHSSGNETPNPLVEAAVKINASSMAMLAGAEVDWDEIERENEKWFRLLEKARKLVEGSIFIGKADFEIVEAHPTPYAWCEDRFVLVQHPWPSPSQLRTPKSTSPSAD